MSSARIGVKPIKSIQKARAKAAHIFREDGVAPGGGTPNIIPFKKPEPGAFSHTNMMDQQKKRKLQKDEQTYRARANKYRTQDKLELAIKQDEKVKQIEKQLAETQHTNSKKYVHFVEFELVITEFRPNEKSGMAFSRDIPVFLKEFFKDDIELIAGAVHLDQSSLHGHVIIKPLKMWSELIDRIANPEYYQSLDSIRAKYADLKRSDRSDNAKEQRKQRDLELKSIYRKIPDPLYVLTQAWWDFMNVRIKNPLKPIVRGGEREYVDLPTYKKMSKNIEERTLALDIREKQLTQKEDDLAQKNAKISSIVRDLEALGLNINSINELKIQMKKSENELSNLSKQKDDQFSDVQNLSAQLEEIKKQKNELLNQIESERKELEKIAAMYEKKGSDDLTNTNKR